MYHRKIEKQYGCGMEVTVEVIGGKWKACIINHLNEGKKRPSEIKRYIPEASRRALENQLTEMELHGIITKTIYPVMPPKVEYELTDLGRTLLPITLAMEEWGVGFKESFLQIKQQQATLAEDL
jgi:DNA-binding HxlR family transcriptional regulator